MAEFAVQWGWPLIAKTPRGGYDRNGVWTLPDIDAAERLMARVGEALLIEPKLAFERELAVLVARTATGDIRTYPVVETIQQNAACREVLAPVTGVVAAAAADLARRAAVAVDAVGICAAELFLTGDRLAINELALRPHNSGHYSIEGTTTSQFEQHLRAVLGWPLGATTLTAPAVASANILGAADGSDPAQRLPQALAIPDDRIHLYSITARAGRKTRPCHRLRAEPVRSTRHGPGRPDTPRNRGAMTGPVVGIVMGSDSDSAVMTACATVLDEFSVDYEMRVISANRTPADMLSYANGARDRGLRVILAGTDASLAALANHQYRFAPTTPTCGCSPTDDPAPTKEPDDHIPPAAARHRRTTRRSGPEQ